MSADFVVGARYSERRAAARRVLANGDRALGRMPCLRPHQEDHDQDHTGAHGCEAGLSRHVGQPGGEVATTAFAPMSKTLLTEQTSPGPLSPAAVPGCRPFESQPGGGRRFPSAPDHSLEYHGCRP